MNPIYTYVYVYKDIDIDVSTKKKIENKMKARMYTSKRHIH